MVIAWEEISVINYIRGIVFLIGIAFVPGASIFNLLFHNSKLHEKFQIEPFFIKIWLYPIISFALMGSYSLILDHVGLHTAGDCTLNRYEIALETAKIFNQDLNLITPSSNLKQKATRPKNCSLNITKLKALIGSELPTLNLKEGLYRMKKVKEVL